VEDRDVLFGGVDIQLPCESLKRVLFQQNGDRKDRDPSCVLLDVREEWEYRYVRFPGSLHIPLSRLPENLERIPSDRLVIVYCHTGIRSLLACYLLRQNGFLNVKNLEGGIDAYALKVDSRLPRYRLEQGRRPPEAVLLANAKGESMHLPHPWGEGVTEEISWV
jgi:rhodanese-related sulfurtransferase